MTTQPSVLLADDHRLLCDTLAIWLRRTQEISAVWIALSSEDAIKLARLRRPTIVVMDTVMPGLGSFRAAQIIQADCPETRIIFLGDACSDREVANVLALRAAGYVLKSEAAARVLEAIRKVVAGGTYYSPIIEHRIVTDRRSESIRPEQYSRGSTLTPREVDIIRYIADGMANKNIARAAGISEKTVGRHIENMMRKLELHNRVDLARFAIQEGLAER